MKITQLSIFLENRVGVINEVTAILGSNNINMKAFSVAEGVEFGILRLIVSDAEKAKAVLEDAGFKVNSTEVISFNTPNTSGALSKVMEYLAGEGVFIQYMYAYSEGQVASIVIRPNNIERCEQVLEKCCTELSGQNPEYAF